MLSRRSVIIDSFPGKDVILSSLSDGFSNAELKGSRVYRKQLLQIHKSSFKIGVIPKRS